MKKRIVSFLMALVMAVSLLPVSAFAAEDAPAVKFEYSPPDSDVKVIGTYQVDDDTKWDVRLVTVDSTQYNYVATINSKTGVISTVKHAIGDVLPAGDRIASHYKNSEMYKAGAQLYTQLKDNLKLTEELNADATQTCFYNFKYTARGKKVTAVYGILIIQWTAGELVIPDKTALQTAIGSAPTADDGKYYTTGDRFNGKNTSQNGFWADYQSVLQAANKTNENASATQIQIDNAVAELQTAIGNLIPTSRVNATALYEALNTKWCWYGEDHMLSTVGDPVSADNCTTLSWQPYAKAVKDGQALLDTLYENGTPTDDNIAAKQEAVDKLAAAIDVHKLVNKEAYAAAYNKYMAAKPEAEALLQQYDPAKLEESDYTADSWTAYTNAHAVLKTDMAYRIVGGTTEDWKMLQGFNGYYAYNDAGQWTQYVAHIEALK